MNSLNHCRRIRRIHREIRPTPLISLTTAVLGIMLMFSFIACENSTLGEVIDPSSEVHVEPESGWNSLAPLPEKRWQVGTASLDGIVYLAGGAAARERGGWEPRPEIFAYDPVRNDWQKVGALIKPVRSPAVAAIDGLIYVVGGARNNPSEFEPSADLQIFDPLTGTVVMGSPMPTPRVGLAVAVLDGRIHAIGGVNAKWDPIMGDWDNTHEVFDPATGTWSTLAPMPSYRGGHGAVAIDGMIYVAGGLGETLEVYDPATDSWTSYGSPRARFDVAVVALGGMMYVIGGNNQEANPTSMVERFNPELAYWEAVEPMPTSRSGLGAAVVGNAIYVIAGSTTGPYVNFTSINERYIPK